MWRSAGWLAKHKGVTRQTANRWIHEGKFDKIQKTEGGHYRVWCPPEGYRLVGYCRVSSAKQKSSLGTQEKIIRNKYPGIEIVRDIGSGFNFDRKGLKALLERCLRGDAITLVVTTQDRVARSGYQFIRWVIELHGGRVVILEDTPTTEEFDSETLIAFVTSFIASYHGKRAGRRKRENQNLPRKPG